MVFFSVIIPVFNRAALIEAAIASVFNQTFSDYEVTVVDDGSTDDTLAVLQRYRNTSTKAAAHHFQILQQPNRGAGAARNLGIYHASGQYITFLDSDDVWFPWTLTTYEQAIQAADHPAFIAGNGVFFRKIEELSQHSSASLQMTGYSDYLASSQAGLWIGTCAVALRADFLHQVGGFVEQRMNAEDSDLWLKLGTVPGFVSIQSPPVFGYRQHGQSAIAHHDRTYEGIQYLIQQEKKGQYPGTQSRQRERLRVLTCHVRPVSLACLQRGQIRQGWGLYWVTLRWHLQLGRIRYLIGFLVRMGWAVMDLVQNRTPIFFEKLDVVKLFRKNSGF